MLRLFYAWLLLQCFFYKAIPALRWGVGFYVTPDKIALFALLSVCMIHLRAPSGTPTDGTRAFGLVEKFLLLFSIVALASWMVYGGDSGSTAFGQLTRVVNLTLFPALAYAIARRMTYTASMVQELMLVLAVFGVYLALTAIAEHHDSATFVFPAYIRDPSIGTQFGRSRGPFVDTIGNGGMLVQSFLALSWLTAATTRFKYFAIAVPLVVVPAIYLTETRGVWIAFAVVVATSFAMRTGHRRVSAVVVVVLCLAFVIGIGSKFSLSDQTLFTRRQQTVDYRLDNYDIAWTAFKANPIFGLGIGNLAKQWSHYTGPGSSRLGEGLADGNHSTLLGILAELGLAGAIPFVASIVASVVVCLKINRHLNQEKMDDERRLLVVAIGALETFVVLGLTNDLRTTPTVNICAFWFIGMIARLTPRVETGISTFPRRGAQVATRRLHPFARSRPLGDNQTVSRR